MIFKERSMLPEPPLADPFLQRYRDYTRQRQMTLGDMLLENRIVFLEGVINDAVAIYFLDATLAAAFVSRWCVGSTVEVSEGAFRVREDRPTAREQGRPHKTF